MKHKLSEEDLEKIFISSQSKRRNPIYLFLSFLALFAIFFAIISYGLNFSAINKQIAWWHKDQFGIQPHALIDAVTKYQSVSGTTTANPFPEIPNNSVYIESINTKAPIVFDVQNNEKSVSENLKNGVIQIAGTSKPGENGNIFITGHSSNFPWVKSNYNSVFALLPNMVVGDLVLIKFNETDYFYRVEKIFVVDPSDTSVLKSRSESNFLTLMTCAPVGTNLKRLIVEAKQIIPISPQNPGTGNSVTLPQGVR